MYHELDNSALSRLWLIEPVLHDIQNRKNFKLLSYHYNIFYIDGT